MILPPCGKPSARFSFSGLRTADRWLASAMAPDVRFSLTDSLDPYPQPPVRVSLEEIRSRKEVPVCRVPWREAWRATSTLHPSRAELVSGGADGADGVRQIRIPPQSRWVQGVAMFCAGVGMAVVAGLPFRLLSSLAGGRGQPDFQLQDLWWLLGGGLVVAAALPWLGRRRAQPVLTFFRDAGFDAMLRLEDGGSEWPVADIDHWILVCRTDWGEDGGVGALLFVLRDAPPDQAVMVSRFRFPLDALRQVARLAAEETSRPLREMRF